MGSNRTRAVLATALVALAVVLWVLLRKPHVDPAVRTTASDSGAIAAPPREPEPAPVQAAVDPQLAAADVTVVPLDDAGHADAHASHTFATATWGSGPDQLGHERLHEGNAEGPMSMVADAAGNVLVLDQINHRLVRYDRDGHAAGTVPLTQMAPQDVAVARDGTIAVLDRLSDKSVTLMGPDGSTRGTLSLEGANVPEGGGVTGLIVDGDDVYAEREHGALVRLGGIDGTADQNQGEIPGRPTRDGLSYITAGLIDQENGRFYVNSIARDTQQHRFTRALQVPLALSGILLLDTDRAGTIYTAVVGDLLAATATGAAGAETVSLLCLDPTDGHPIGITTLPPNTMPEESFRDMIVLDGGGVLYSMRTEQGVTLQRYDCN